MCREFDGTERHRKRRQRLEAIRFFCFFADCSPFSTCPCLEAIYSFSALGVRERRQYIEKNKIISSDAYPLPFLGSQPC